MNSLGTVTVSRHVKVALIKSNKCDAFTTALEVMGFQFLVNKYTPSPSQFWCCLVSQFPAGILISDLSCLDGDFCIWLHWNLVATCVTISWGCLGLAVWHGGLQLFEVCETSLSSANIFAVLLTTSGRSFTGLVSFNCPPVKAGDFNWL